MCVERLGLDPGFSRSLVFYMPVWCKTRTVRMKTVKSTFEVFYRKIGDIEILMGDC